jgi:hypothetical protein
MVEIDRILCPVDLSEFSRHALDHALALAKWYDAASRYVSGASPLPGLPDDAVLPPLRPDEMAEDVRRFCGLPITAPCGPAAVVVKEGTPARIGHRKGPSYHTRAGADRPAVGRTSGVGAVQNDSVSHRILQRVDSSA